MSRQGRAIAGVALIGVGVAIATGWWWPATAAATAKLDERVHTVDLDNDSGDVSVVADDVQATTVRQRFDYSWSEPDNAFTLEDGTLTLADCGWQCDVDYEVVVPLGTKVHGEVDSGDITLDGVAEVDVHADSGNVTVRDVEGPVRAEADSGDVRGQNLGGPVEAQADSGDVVLQLDTPADVTATADSGDVTVTVPEGTYRVEGDTDAGSRNIEVPADPDAEHLLSLDSDSGDVTVRTR